MTACFAFAIQWQWKVYFPLIIANYWINLASEKYVCKSYTFRNRNVDLWFFFNPAFNSIFGWDFFLSIISFWVANLKKYWLNSCFNFFFYNFLCFIYSSIAFWAIQQLFLISLLFYYHSRLSVVIFIYLLLRGTIRTFCKRVKDFLLHCTALCSTWCFSITWMLLPNLDVNRIIHSGS